MRVVLTILFLGVSVGALALWASAVSRSSEFEPSQIVKARWGEFQQGHSTNFDPIELLMALTERASSLQTPMAGRPAPADIARQASWWRQG